MNDVQAWLNEEGSYSVGLQLYLQHPKHNRLLANNLAGRQTAKNRQKLEYELVKLYRRYPLEKAKADDKPKAAVITASKADVSEQLQQSATNRFNQHVGLKDLHPSLHEKFILQKNTFYKIWGLHYKLEYHQTDAERLESLREIMAGWELINAIWKEIDYYLQYKTLLPQKEAEDFKGLSPEKLAQRKLTTRSNLNRYKKKVAQLQEAHDTEKDLAEKNKLFQKLSQAKKTLGNNEIRLARLNQLING